MSATPDYTIDEKDIFKISQCNLACGLPYFKSRSQTYLQLLTEKDNPQVIMIQGASPDCYTLQGALRQAGYLAVGTYRKSVYEGKDDGLKPSVNMTWVAPDVQVLGSRNRSISIADKNGLEQIIAPDCVITTIYHRGRMMDLYNMENVPGVFRSEARMIAAGIVNRDAYMLKTQNREHFKSLLIMGASMHVDPEGQSVRYLEGRLTRRGYAPSGWLDVWEELNPDVPSDRSATQRLEMDALYDDDIVFPQFMRGKRHAYMFVYNDVFGKIGTPVKIERNGMDSTNDGIPLSNSFGLTLSLYMPTYNRFTTEDAFVQNDSDDMMV